MTGGKKMDINWKKLTAMGCSILYVLLYLFLPVLALKLVGIGASGSDLFSITAWSYLPLIMGIGMAVCAVVAPSKVSGAVCTVGVFIPLITYFIIRSQIISNTISLTGISGLGSMVGIGTNAIFTVGAGVVLPILLGIGASVLCFLADQYSRPKERTPGLSAGADDDW